MGMTCSLNWMVPSIKGEAAVCIPSEKPGIGILPQLLNEIDQPDVKRYINCFDYCAQEKKDGRRRILRHVFGKTIGINKKGIISKYPAVFAEACKELAKQNGVYEFTLDGEEVGETYYIFDLLTLNGRSLRESTYWQRQKKMRNLRKSSGCFHFLPTAYTPKEKRELYNTLKKEGKEGIVFKLVAGKHLEEYSNEQIKFKFNASASVIVIGHNRKNSVAIAVMNQGTITPVGNVTTIGHEKPAVGSVIEVRYLYYCPGGALCQPVYLGPRDDTDKEDCTLEKLKLKAAA